MAAAHSDQRDTPPGCSGSAARAVEPVLGRIAFGRVVNPYQRQRRVVRIGLYVMHPQMKALRQTEPRPVHEQCDETVPQVQMHRGIRVVGVTPAHEPSQQQIGEVLLGKRDGGFVVGERNARRASVLRTRSVLDPDSGTRHVWPRNARLRRCSVAASASISS